MKFEPTNPAVSIATLQHIPVLEQLLNQAYRGEASREGWTTEAHLIAGDTRTDMANIEKVIRQEGSVFLIYSDNDNIVGCVNLQKGDGLYLGMFSVLPKMQGNGIGKILLQASEEYARLNQINRIYMSVISVREDIIAWYLRHGYRDSGERKPFVEDKLTGRHLQPLEFMILEKIIR